MSLAGESVARACGSMQAMALQLLSTPGNACANNCERQGVDDLRHRERRKTLDQKEAEHHPEERRQQPRPEPAKASGRQHCRNEEQKG